MLKRSSSPIAIRNKCSFLSIFKRKDKKCCEQSEKCAEPPTVSKYIVQKSCGPSIFEAWKPKLPDLNSCNYPSIKANLMMPYKHKTCAAGMKLRDPNRCEIETKAKECLKKCHPKWMMHKCPSGVAKIQSDIELPVLAAAALKCKNKSGYKIVIKPKSMRKKCKPEIPEADWDVDGRC